jgi:endonuclease-3
LDKRKIAEDVIRTLKRVYPSGAKPGKNPHRDDGSTEKDITLLDPFQVLIATILSQRTRDENTHLACKALFARYPTPGSLAAARIEEIESLIKPVGFYHIKARRINEVSRLIVERFNGHVPEDMDTLLTLPGVGRKTANCVLAYGFNRDAIPVDTHVHRISNRLGLVTTDDPEETEVELSRIVRRKDWKDINTLFVRFGQTVCRPVSPRCRECPFTFCRSRRV